MGLGRTTRFAPLPAGARRISVMRSGTAGLKALAPSAELLAAFQARKRALTATGTPPDRAHVEASRAIRYRDRFRREIRSNPEARAALRQVIAQAKVGDLYLMCMCPWKTPRDGCHTYLLLELARDLDPGLRLLPEPAPRRAGAGASQRPPAGGHPTHAARCRPPR